TAGELEARLGPLGAKLAIDVADRLEVGPVGGEQQDKSQVTKAPKLTKEMGLIDWSQPADVVANQVRAMQPWPTPYTFLRRPEMTPLRVLVLRSSPAPAPALPDAAGSIAADGARLFVRCGSGTCLEVLEL